MLRFLIPSIILAFLVLGGIPAHAQQYLLKGRVTNANMEALPFVTVQVKELKMGTKTDENGQFQFQLEEGKYELIFSLLGYEKYSLQVIHQDGRAPIQVILNEASNQLKEIRIANFRKDRAEEIIRNVIANKNKHYHAVNSYRVNVYIKALEEQTDTKKSNAERVLDSLEGRNKLAAMSMAEISLKLDYAYPNKIKEERVGVKKSGSNEGLFFLSTTEGQFELYPNLIQVPALSKTPMLSPLSYSGLVAYKYKTLGIRKLGNANIYTIQFSPTRMGNALLEGSLQIVDTSWAVIQSQFRFPKFHMPEYDFFEVVQEYEWMENKAWMISKQSFNYYSKSGRNKLNGRTIALYTDYQLDTTFSKRYFGTEISATSNEAYQRDSTFWNTVRAEPLSKEEINLIHFKDSVQIAQSSTKYLDSVDRQQNRLTLLKIALNGVNYYHRKSETRLSFNPLMSVYRPFMPGGARIGTGGSYEKMFPSKKRLWLNADINYGLVNPNLMGDASVTYRYNPFSQGYIRLDFGREFDFIFWGDAWVNRFRRSNFYRKDHVRLEHGLELVNGLMFRAMAEYANRRSLDGLSFNHQFDSIISEFVINNDPIIFEPYKAFYGGLTLEYTPFQMYNREPLQKIILGSKYPTFYVNWRKGIPGILNSTIDFDYLEIGIKQRLKLGLAGISRYNFYTGTFLSQKDLRYVDYKFISRGNPYLFNNPLASFQMLDSSFPIFNRFYEGHYIHEFNGAILNKIPVLKQLQLMEIIGGGILYVPERKLQYIEAFVGVEKVIRFWRERFKFGLYLAGSVASKYNRPLQLKIGIERWDRWRNDWYE